MIRSELKQLGLPLDWYPVGQFSSAMGINRNGIVLQLKWSPINAMKAGAIYTAGFTMEDAKRLAQIVAQQHMMIEGRGIEGIG